VTAASIRCAIYTRKSTDEGLDQSFNSLDAQREACEAYIRSQAGEGWKALATCYDDGGFSGGNLNRPAMQQLLADVDAGKVDVIVVYKVDRLTRSLLDFAKVVERLDAGGVSFVSVTQAFNTTTSMGRLTLNVLLSFAQFEREVTGERIRDKIAASKAKGMWMGGNVPLGYDVRKRQLIVNEREAEQVRYIFTRYLELGSGVLLMKELRATNILSKCWISRAGQERGGQPFSCGALYYLLQNRIYLGEIVHRGVCHAGQHDAILPAALFDDVQQVLAANRQVRRDKPARKDTCMLAGLLVDMDGKPLTTSFSYGRGGRMYRYYVQGSLDPSRAVVPAKRIPAAPMERAILAAVRALFDRPLPTRETLAHIARVEVYDRSIQVVLRCEGLLEPHEPIERACTRLQTLVGPTRLVTHDRSLRLIIDRGARFRGGKSGGRSNAPGHQEEGIQLFLLAHKLLEQHSMSPQKPELHVHASAPVFQRQRHLMALGLLSPAMQKSIVHGNQVSLSTLISLPLAWNDQTTFHTNAPPC
jgi:site-specific DNA recombinase